MTIARAQKPDRATCPKGSGLAVLIAGLMACFSPAPVHAQSGGLVAGELPHDQGQIHGLCLGWTQAHLTSLTARYKSRQDKELQSRLRTIGRRAQTIERSFNKISRDLARSDLQNYSDFLIGYVEGLNSARNEAFQIHLTEGESGILAVYDEVVIRCPI
ncbi:MAG: hypothetical protein Alpg2KO_19480 [Alphaproteobacteria bacterium]